MVSNSTPTPRVRLSGSQAEHECECIPDICCVLRDGPGAVASQRRTGLRAGRDVLRLRVPHAPRDGHTVRTSRRRSRRWLRQLSSDEASRTEQP